MGFDPKPARSGDGSWGENLPNSVADVERPFPWLKELREVSPVTALHSYLIPYWYRAKERWVLYDLLPTACIGEDDMVNAGFTAKELRAAMNGKAPWELADHEQNPFVSGVQYAMWHKYGGYARPFWVLQGDRGGHQVKFSPWQQNVLIAKGLQPDPPALGALPFAPFDGRAARQLQHLNRLHEFENSIEALRKSGTKAAAEAEMERIQKEIRLAEMRFTESQMEPLVDMATSLVRGQNTRSEYESEIVRVAPGKAAEAAEAYDRYLETGDWTLRDVTGQKR